VEAARPPAFSRIHTTWLVCLFMLGVAYIGVIPPFKSIDEVAHWDRTWTVATGQLNCKWIPKSASEFVYLVNDPKVTSMVVLTRAMAFTGSDGKLPIATASCMYPPIGFLAPAMAVRFIGLDWGGHPVEGGMFWSFYTARFVNWLLFFGTLWFVAWRLPWARSLMLLIGSVPEVLQQSTALNQDALLFACTLLVFYAWQAKPSWRSIGLAVGASVIASVMKPFYAGYALITLLIVPRMTSLKAWQRWAVPAGGALLSVGAWWLWLKIHHVDATAHQTHLPVVVSPSQQSAYVFSSAWIFPKLLLAQITQFFGHDPIRGSLGSFLGAFGWCQFEVYQWVYHLMLAGIGLMLAADVVGPEKPALLPRAPRWAWALFLASVLAQFPVVVYAMYLYFTTYKSEGVLGMQGRYMLSLLIMLGSMGLYVVKARVRFASRSLSQALTIAAAGACLVANVGALLWVDFFYWI
jgi:uncharacterized membrane protein